MWLRVFRGFEPVNVWRLVCLYDEILDLAQEKLWPGDQRDCTAIFGSCAVNLERGKGPGNVN